MPVLIASVTCGDCDGATAITLESFGAAFMTKIECENCGVSYDTNLDETEITHA